MKTAARSYHRHMAWASAIAFSLAVLLAVAVRSSGEDLAPAGKNPGRLDVSLAELMQVKLTASQEVLEGLVQGDTRMVARAAGKLREIARTEDWATERKNDAVFGHFNVEFQRLSESLLQTAEQGNASGAAWISEQLTATCISCHNHVRDVKRLPER